MHGRYQRLNHGDFLARGLGAHLVYHPGGLQYQQAGLLDLDARLGDPVADIGVLMQIPAECLALLAALDHQLQRQLGHADGAHAVMNTPWAKTRLGHHETRALLTQQTAQRYPHIA
ncbi:hypothetical protein FQZ97_1195760 [compost metagenome]